MGTMDYISYSQLNTYKCPRSWYLAKIAKGEEKQTWYLPIGTAVHSMIEYHLDPTKPDSPDAESFLYPLIEAQRAIEPDVDKWMASGPKEAPFVREKAVQLVRDCFENAVQELEQIDVWAIEYDASGNLPGLEVPVRAYIDLIGEHKKKGPVIIDWKTGSTKPGNFQLETYAALLDYNTFKHGSMWDPAMKGRYVMLAPGTVETRYVDLSSTDWNAIGAKYQQVYERMRDKHYEANAGFDCRFCLQQENCLVQSGMTQRAIYYDRSAEDGFPF